MTGTHQPEQTNRHPEQTTSHPELDSGSNLIIAQSTQFYKYFFSQNIMVLFLLYKVLKQGG
jgi:hypothetical protein